MSLRTEKSSTKLIRKHNIDDNLLTVEDASVFGVLFPYDIVGVNSTGKITQFSVISTNGNDLIVRNINGYNDIDLDEGCQIYELHENQTLFNIQQTIKNSVITKAFTILTTDHQIDDALLTVENASVFGVSLPYSVVGTNSNGDTVQFSVTSIDGNNLTIETINNSQDIDLENGSIISEIVKIIDPTFEGTITLDNNSHLIVFGDSHFTQRNSGDDSPNAASTAYVKAEHFGKALNPQFIFITNYNINVQEYAIIDLSFGAGSKNLHLPTNVPHGSLIGARIKIPADGQILTIISNAADHINDGNTSQLVLSNKDDAVLLVYDLYENMWQVLTSNLFTPIVSPTIVAGSGAGTSPIVSMNGSDNSGKINVLTGTTPGANAVIATITYNNPRGIAPKSIVLTAANLATASVQIYISNITTTTFVIASSLVALTSATQYSWYFSVSE